MIRTLFARIGKPESPPPWGLGAAIASLVAAFAALVLGSTLVLTLYCASPTNAPFCAAVNFAPPPAVTLIGWTVGAAITAAFVWITRREPNGRAALRLGAAGSSVFWVLLVSIGLAVTVDLLLIQFTTRVTEPELQGLRGGADAAAFLAALVFMALAQPIAEELVFRGIMQPALRHAVGPWPGYLGTAALYGVFHLLAYSPAAPTGDDLWYGFLLPLVGGLIFGAVRLYTGSTRAAILAHAAFGVFAVLKVLALG